MTNHIDPTIRVVLAVAIAGLLTVGGAARQADSAQSLLRAASDKAAVDGDMAGAIKQYQAIVTRFRTDRTVVAAALVAMAECYQKLGDAESRQIYERVVREFADQTASVTTARARLAMLASPSPSAAPRATRQSWSGSEVDAMGAPSSDGRYLSFTDWETGDLAVRDLRAGTNRRLTNTGGWAVSSGSAEFSIFSPDGRQVAYAWFVNEPAAYELRVISTATGGLATPRVVHRSAETLYVMPHAWTPDGKEIVVVRWLRDKTSQIALIAVADGAIRVLKSFAWRFPEKASLSPDGRFIAYDSPAADNMPAQDIFVLATDGSGETTLIQSPANDHAPMWAPVGSQVVFLSDRTGGTESLWTVRVNGARPSGAPELLNPNIGRIVPLGFAASGALYYVTGGGRNGHIAELDSDLKVTKAPALISERFINSNGPAEWSPNGEQLAYYSYRGPRLNSPGATVVAVRTLTSGEERDLPLRLEVTGFPPSAPKWFPDGKSILVVSRERQGLGYHRLDLATGAIELLHTTKDTGPSSAVPSISADGQAIYYIDGDDPGLTGRTLRRFDLKTRQTTELTGPDRTPTSFALSPDGAQIAYLTSERNRGSALEIMPAVGGPPRQLAFPANWFESSRYGGVTWTPDQRFLLFVRRTGVSGPQTLWRIPVMGGAPESTGISGSVTLPRLHPDGRRLTFGSSLQGAGELWGLEDFLPNTAAPQRRP
jgi:Tol biopolymer transport system component